MGEEERPPPSRRPALELQEGCYLVKERKPLLSYRLFDLLRADGKEPLIISRRHPTRLRAERDLEGTRLVWLSHTPGEDFHNPGALGSLNKLICRFIQEQEGALVLLDGLEYLTLHNDFVQTLLFVEHVNEFVMQHPAYVLVPLDPEALDPKELALLERNVEVIDGDALRKRLEREEVLRLIDTY